MRILFALLAFFQLGYAHAFFCIPVNLEEEIERAETIFIATITSSSLVHPIETALNGRSVEVKYDYVVAKLLRGDPSNAPDLSMPYLYNEPWDPIVWQTTVPEVRLVPGDSVLFVYSDPSDFYLSGGNCAPSRRWDEPTREKIGDLLGLPRLDLGPLEPKDLLR